MNKLFPYIITVIVSIASSVLVCLFLFETEAGLWKKAAYKSIQEKVVIEKQALDLQSQAKELILDFQNNRRVSIIDSLLIKHGL